LKGEQKEVCVKCDHNSEFRVIQLNKEIWAGNEERTNAYKI